MKVDPGRAVGVAILSIFGGTIVGAFLFAIFGAELAKLDSRPEDAAGFFKGLLFGAVFGGIVGHSIYRSWRKRAESPPELADLTPAEASASFVRRLRARSGAVATMTVGFAAYWLLRDHGIGTAMWSAPFIVVGGIVYLFSSRCPMCGAFLDGKAAGARTCARCSTTFQ